MHRFFILFFSVFLFVFAASANANEIVVNDQEERFSLSYPDHWFRKIPMQADDRLVISAPDPEADAVCRMRVRTDRRFLIYPHGFQDEVQRLNYGLAYVRDYLSIRENVSIKAQSDFAGFGRGFATYAEADYTEEGKERRRGIVFASLYHDKVYIMDCSAKAGAYYDRRADFMNIIRSVDFKKVLHEFPSGHYRNFMRDGKVRIAGESVEHDSYY